MSRIAPADQRILAGSAAVLSMRLLDADGEVDSGASDDVTVTVTRGDGTAIATSAAADASAAARTYALSRAQTAAVDRLTAVWSIGATPVRTTVADVVGAHWFAPSQLKQREGMRNVATPDIVTARDSFSDLADRVTGVAWTPRWWSETIISDGGCVIVTEWPELREVLSVTVDGDAQALADWDIDLGPGVLHAPASIARGAIIAITYRHGFDRPPGPLVDAALEACEWKLTADTQGVSPRALGFSNEFGNYRFASADADRPTGLPDVDAILETYSRRIPGMA